MADPQHVNEPMKSLMACGQTIRFGDGLHIFNFQRRLWKHYVFDEQLYQKMGFPVCDVLPDNLNRLIICARCGVGNGLTW